MPAVPAADPRVTVVVATRDRPQRLRAALASLRAQSYDAAGWELVIVDDASVGDETAAVVAVAAAATTVPIRLIARDRPGGPGGARNEGWRAARGALVAFTDDDCEHDPGCRRLGRAAGSLRAGRNRPDRAGAARL